MDMSKKVPHLEKVLRDALKKSGYNTNVLGKMSGVPQSIVWRFLNEERSISLTTASKLVEALGLELRPTRKR